MTRSEPVAVVDLGSNSARAVVLRPVGKGHLEIVEDVQASLRLVQAMDDDGRFGPEVLEETLEIMRGFRAVAVGAGAGRIFAVATSAVRDSVNGEELVGRLNSELGFEMEIISGEQEASYAFLGAVHSLPVEHGMFLDQGGGSMQLVRFDDRQLKESWSFPLGALRLSARFLEDDPPDDEQVRRLTDHVREKLEEAGVPVLRGAEQLIGTGGTIRTLGRIDRKTHNYPVSRLHGYVLSHSRLNAIVRNLTKLDPEAREQVPGLNHDRVDSIVGGAVAIETVMKVLSARELVVSGQGLRDGVALERLGMEGSSPASVRAGAMEALTHRFGSWREEPASRRREIALKLLDVVEPGADEAHAELLGFGAVVLDIGRSVDYYNRHRHTAEILMSTDLNGFTHRSLALLAAVVERAGGSRAVKGYRPLVTEEDEPFLSRYGGLLAVADELERLYPPGAPVDLSCQRRGGRVVLQSTTLAPEYLTTLQEQYPGAFG